ncbi:Arginyl-tRNA synthetase [Deinococcus proteolyticus MRP]|uniref:Arginine--tRNA ligase n=1 Tax=Deinococcus proteolyticus (strain ATCC 35074 / DSM 20540 / JCM 6276 / NBRC 101906 / NCIMB 13154 / VKM Ac-1939 / CCM 2703 / MRP) TaxID=693977 RepID=F0RKU7_DEIPM|nr:arginine--tRNA ligase [Deinococcus proteolyticus]ADY26809.1 Arginyl-tRNA synthetase [Deinococcus proteolyticus MRP]
MELKAQLKQAVQQAAQALGAELDPAIQETPAGKKGDYGTPAAFQLAKMLGRNPAEVAQDLARSIQLPAGIARVEAAGPFLNFFVDVADFVRGVVENPTPMPQQEGKVVIEHTSVNPNKELHVGHLRNVVLGDSLARIMRAAGHTVEVQNYIDDTGRQAAESLFARDFYHLEWDGQEKYDHWMGKGYVRLNADPAKPEQEEGIRAVMHRLEAGELRAEIERIVQAHLDTCFRLGARYDLLNWESDVVGSGFLSKAMNILEESRYTSRPTEGKYAGAFVMDVSEFMPGLEEPNVVLVRSDGTAMYAAKDIGYQFWKFGLFEGMKFKPFATDPEGNTVWTSAPDGEPDTERRFGHAAEVINVIDSRQNHPQTVVRSSLGVAGEQEKKDRSIHLSYAFVTLEGQTISGRKGIAVAADEVMDEAVQRSLKLLGEINPELAAREDAAEIARRIGIGAIRFAMLKAEPTRQIDFRWDSALALTGDTAPYVQYAAVRAGNILRKAEAEGYAVDGSGADWAALPDIDLALAKAVARLPEVVEQATRIHSPHVVAQYALDLATTFNSWYNAKDKVGKPATNVLQSPEGLREARLALVGRVRRAFEETLDLIGIEVPAAM